MIGKILTSASLNFYWKYKYNYIRAIIFSLWHRKSFTASLFNEIYQQNLWGVNESSSGPGSSMEATQLIRQEITNLLNELNVMSILDVPCGDFHWMSRLELNNIQYIGGDIVQELVIQNNNKYLSKRRKFKQIDLCYDQLPKCDLVITRDLFIHLSNKKIMSAIKNIANSECKYWIVSIASQLGKNTNIPTGGCRTVNLCLPPYGLPPPIRYLQDGSEKNSSLLATRSMALWEVKQLRNS